MFKLSYSLNSVPNNLSIEEACNSLAKFGYPGVELSFQPSQFDPFLLSDDRIEMLQNYFKRAHINPVCISTATTKFLSDIPHEPSLINIDPKSRAKRTSLIEKGIALACKLGIPLVSFQSGYLREEHSNLSRQLIMQIITTEINSLLSKIHGDIELVIEPEPGMFIETISDAQELIRQVNDTRFGLHIDIGHAFCSEENYINTIFTAARDAKYIHLADIREGHNLRYFMAKNEDIDNIVNKKMAEGVSSIYDIDGSGLYIFSQDKHVMFVGVEKVIKDLAKNFDNVQKLIIDLDFLNKNISSDIKQEIIAYLDSISGTDYKMVSRAYDAIACLRLGNSCSQPMIKAPVCNTIKGKVHYHDLFGRGKIDYAQVISALIESGYNGYCTVELYNHAFIWEDVAPRSAKFILSKIMENFGWESRNFGHIDHRKVIAPYIRVADAQMGKGGDISILYDLRLCQPNTTTLPATVLHTLEHCFLWILPDLIPGFLNVGPMGCQTGLYLTAVQPIEYTYIRQAIITTFERILELEKIPYQSEVTCGMAINHDLEQAKYISDKALAVMKSHRISEVSS